MGRRLKLESWRLSMSGDDVAKLYENVGITFCLRIHLTEIGHDCNRISYTLPGQCAGRSRTSEFVGENDERSSKKTVSDEWVDFRKILAFIRILNKGYSVCRGNQTGVREFLHSPSRLLRLLTSAKTCLLDFCTEKIEEEWSCEQDDRMAVDLI